MRTEFIRVYKAIHTWTGILAGMALFIAFYAGALTLFKTELTRWASPPPANTGQPFRLDDAPALIARTLKEHPEVAKDFRLQLQTSAHPPPGLSWEVRQPNADDHDAAGAHHYVAVLETDGAVAVTQVHPPSVADFIDTLHRVVGLPTDTDPARWVMGVVAALYAVALFSGVIVLLPSLVKDFFALRVGKNLKRMWLDAHNVVGIISLPFHVVMALTAVVFAYHDGFYAVQDTLIHNGKWSAATQGRSGPGPATAVPRDALSMLAPADLLRIARAYSPTFEANALQYLHASTPRATVRIWGHDPHAHSPRFVGGFVALDPYSGKILNTDYMPGRQSFANALIASFFALHFGTYGGALVQWIYFLLGLAGAWLFYSGNLLWVETRRKQAARHAGAGATPPTQRRDVRWMAAATVGVCLGAIGGMSLTLSAAKWLHGRVDDLALWHPIIYYAVFFGALLWALRRGAARAGVELLYMAAACTFAIPMTSVLAWAIPALGMWNHSSASTLAVDATAFVGGLCLLWLAKVTRHRIAHGPSDSVWSAQHALPTSTA